MKSSTSFPQSAKPQDADIIRKSRFFHVIDTWSNHVIVKNICEQEGIKPDRDKYWFKQRKRFDDVLCRRRPRSDRLKKVSNELMNEILDPQANLVRDQSYTVQLKHFHVNAHKRTLQRAFAIRKPRVERYKKDESKIDQSKERKTTNDLRQIAWRSYDWEFLTICSFHEWDSFRFESNVSRTSASRRKH
jgi:hypothetical protein